MTEVQEEVKTYEQQLFFKEKEYKNYNFNDHFRLKKLKERMMNIEKQNKFFKSQAEANMSSGQKAFNSKIH